MKTLFYFGKSFTYELCTIMKVFKVNKENFALLSFLLFMTMMEIHFILFFSSIESDVADFNGRSSLLYRFNQKSTSTVKDVISLRFKSQRADGVLVHGEGQRGDYITLELHKGRLALHINLGE